MDWIVLFLSGILEAVWAIALSKMDGFKEKRPLIIFIVATILSVLGLAYAMQTLPTGTAYAAWTATGATLTVIYGIVSGAEKATMARIVLLVILVSCVAGLKVVA